MDKHTVEMSDREWKEYIIDQVHRKISKEERLKSPLYDHFCGPLRIISVENGVVQLGFGPPKYQYEDRARDLMISYGEKMNHAFSEVLGEDCRVEILPVIVD